MRQLVNILKSMNRIGKLKHASLLQHDSTDCGAACLASVIRYLGGNSTIEKIRKASGTSQSGTTLLGLYQAAIQFGMEATGYESTVKEIIDYGNVLILHIMQSDGSEHYIVNYGFEKDKFIIWDPAKGLVFLSKEELEKIWISKKCLGVLPGKAFKYENDEKKEKWRWIAEALRPDKEILIISVFVGIVIAILGLAMAIFAQKLIDEILPSGEKRLLIIASVLILAILSARVIFAAIRQYFLLSQGKVFNIRVVNGFYNSLLYLPKYFFDSRKTGDFVARLNDTMCIQRVISDIASVYVIDILILVITLTMISYYSVVVSLISMLNLPVFFFIVHRRNKQIIDYQHEVMAGYALNESNYINSLRGITEIKSLNWQDNFIARNNYIFSDFQERAFRLGRIKINLNLLTGLAGTFYLIILLCYSANEVMTSRMTPGELMAILTLSSTLLPSVLNLALVSIPLNEAKVALSRMFEFTRLDPEDNEVVTIKNSFTFNEIYLKKISFRFTGQRLFLKDIDLAIKKGEIIALVGESGSGKSTLVNIIMRFYIPETGDIIVNDDIGSGSVSMKDWRSSIGVIPQDIHIFNGTVLENILSDITEENVNMVQRLIVENGLEQFFKTFPLGLSTMVGEEGVKLSGGQKQIIAFIRVLYQNPDILIIDEGTSSMDRESELIIVRLIRKIKKDMGVLLITHRVNLIKQLCDCIYVLENGVILDKGTHNELIGYENLYRKCWKDFL